MTYSSRHYAGAYTNRIVGKTADIIILDDVSEDVLDQKDNISLGDYARQERFAQARRMPTDD